MSAKQFKARFRFESNIPRCGNCKSVLDTGKGPKCNKGKMFVTLVSVCDAWVDKKTGDTLETTSQASEPRSA